MRGDELAGRVLNALVERAGVDPAEVEDVQMGCVTQIGEQGWNIGRMAPLVAGWPDTVCGTSVDRQCGSSMQTNFNAAAAIQAGQLDLVVSAGVEMMSRVPMGSNGGSLSPELTARYDIVMQGISAEVIASEWGLSREELDAYSLESHRRAIAATDEGRFENEIVPIEVPDPDAGGSPGASPPSNRLLPEVLGDELLTDGGVATAERVLVADETPRRDTSAERLAGLAPAFTPEGVVTAGNSSQICDGS